MARKRFHIWVSGQVQGVFFRAHTSELAQRLGLTGWVRNLPDGRVEIVAEGEETALRALLDWCREGPPLAQVTNVTWREEPVGDEFSGFIVRR